MSNHVKPWRAASHSLSWRGLPSVLVPLMASKHRPKSLHLAHLQHVAFPTMSMTWVISSYHLQESNFRLIISASKIHCFLDHSLCAKPSANRPVGYQHLLLQNPAMAGHKQLMHKTLLCYLIAAWMTSRFLTDMVTLIFKVDTLKRKPWTILFDTIEGYG